MTQTKRPLLFISYRREDSAAAARWLWEAVKRTFGTDAVFMDLEGVESGEQWENSIKSALENATVVIAIIGSHWLDARDQFNRRRIDRSDDWVRKELAFALESDAKVIPLMLAETPDLEAAAVDPPLDKLAKRQNFRLRNESWERDLEHLLEGLEKLGFVRAPGRTVRYPTPRVTLRELRGAELGRELESLRPAGWDVTKSEVVGVEYRTATTLQKAYEFASFEDAIRFMTAAAPYATELDHHPRWENIWRTVTVWLSTWDIGHRISPLDVKLARVFDEVRTRFPPARPQASR